jgi:predicted PurR-regulated permease PerM
MSQFKASPEYPLWLRGTVILLGLCLLFIILSYGRFILMPLALSALLAMLLEPVSRWLEKLKIGRAFAIVLSMISVFIILAGVFSLLSLQFVQFADRLPEAGDRLQQVSQDLQEFFQSTFGIAPESQINFVEQGIQKLIDRSGQYASTALGATTSVFTTLGLLPIFIFFMMYYKEMYQTFLQKAWKDESNASVDSVIRGIQSVTKNYLVGMLIVIVILGLLNFIGLWIIGLENALFFATFAAAFAIIPYIGIVIGSLPAILFALLFSGSLWMPVAVIIVFAAVQFLEGNFITPNIIGSQVSINPFMALIALLVGAQVWGIVGMILFVPFVGILKCIFDEVEGLQPYGYLLGNSVEYPKGGDSEDVADES